MLSAALIIAALLLRNNLAQVFTPSQIPDFDINRAILDVKDYHVNIISREQFIRGMLNGIASELGTHARCYTPEELQQHNESLDGAFAGIGVRIKMIDGYITVVFPIKNTGSERAGLKTGDRITEADGHSLVNIPFEEATKFLRGPINSTVALKVLREGSEAPLDFTVIRSEVPQSSITIAELLDDNETGYVRIEEFSRETANDLRKAVTSLSESGMKRLIVDLRHNGGGLFNVGVACADLFIDKGVIVISRSGPQDRPDETIYNASRAGTLDPMPIAFLIDGMTASSSEIFAAAMKDHRKALFVGSKTYGKGTVQTTFTENLGGFGLKFTTGLFYSPSNLKIDGNGIEPDITVEMSEEEFQYILYKYSIEETWQYLPNYVPDMRDTKISLDELMKRKDTTLDTAVEALLNWKPKLSKPEPPIAVEHPMDRPGLVE